MDQHDMGVEYGLCDASPLVGVDWLLTECFRCADPSRTYELCRDIQYYHDEAVEYARGERDRDDMDEE
eukprot:7743292-Pyramimonas_sp.AAC.1